MRIKDRQFREVEFAPWVSKLQPPGILGKKKPAEAGFLNKFKERSFHASSALQ